MNLRGAEPNDIPFIMACERRPGYAPYVGNWTEEKHRAGMANAAYRYLIGGDETAARGFALLIDDTLRPENLYLKRIAVYDADKGHGRAIMAALNDWVFNNTDTHRFWLEVVDTNLRAIHLYKSLGFAVEGLVREAYVVDGVRGSFALMSILRPEWLGRAR